MTTLYIILIFILSFTIIGGVIYYAINRKKRKAFIFGKILEKLDCEKSDGTSSDCTDDKGYKHIRSHALRNHIGKL